MDGGGAYTLGRLAEALGATLEGEADAQVVGVAPLETAGPEEVSFLLSARYQAKARTTRAGAVVAGHDAKGLPGAVLRVASPPAAMITLLRLFHPAPPVVPGVHPLASVDPGARVDATAAVGPLAVIEQGAEIGARSRVGALSYVGARVRIGRDTVLHPRVVVGEGVRVGDRVILHPGVVLGADGFGYAFDGVAHRKIPQVGGVRIEDDVEIGANSAVDRATLGETVVRQGTKIDNLVQIGHNCDVGELCIIVAQVGVSGSCRLGRGVVLGGQVGIADHAILGDGAMVAAQSGVPSGDLAGGQGWAGTPARPVAEARRIWAAERLLPDVVRRLRAVERRLAEVESRGR